LAILNPEHLLEQADRLIELGVPGQPRQADLRRAISAAYYAVFHATLAAAADHYVGANRRATSLYSLAYRSADHKELRELCSKIKVPNLSGKLAQYASNGSFDSDTRAFAQALLELQERRHDADYNPSVRARKSDARLAISTARNALSKLRGANHASREAFLALLLFKIR